MKWSFPFIGARNPVTDKQFVKLCGRKLNFLVASWLHHFFEENEKRKQCGVSPHSREGKCNFALFCFLVSYSPLTNFLVTKDLLVHFLQLLLSVINCFTTRSAFFQHDMYGYVTYMKKNSIGGEYDISNEPRVEPVEHISGMRSFSEWIAKSMNDGCKKKFSCNEWL